MNNSYQEEQYHNYLKKKGFLEINSNPKNRKKKRKARKVSRKSRVRNMRG